MSYRLDSARPLASEVPCIAREQLAKAVSALIERPDGIHEALHDARKKFKKVRGLLRLVEAADERLCRLEQRRIRDAARRIAAARDAGALVEAVDKILARIGPDDAPPALGELRGALQDRRDRLVAADVSLEDRIADTVADARMCADALERIVTPDDVRRTGRALADGYAATVEAGRAAARHAGRAGDAEAFHVLRRNIKYHAMHCALLRPLWPELMAVREAAADLAGEELGDDHDVDVLFAAFEAEPGLSGATGAHDWLHDVMEKHRAERRAAGLLAASRLFGAGPAAARREVRALWKAMPHA